MNFQASLEHALELDRNDPLRKFQQDFLHPKVNDRPGIYFLGNSLGLQPKSASLKIQEVLDQWSAHGVEAFFEPGSSWTGYHDRLTTKMAPIVGAKPHEISIQNALTVNLHLLFASFYRPSGKRTKILCESGAFPSDQYMIDSHLRQRGSEPRDHLLEVSPRQGEETILMEDILDMIESHRDELALVFLGGVNYYTGQLFDIGLITQAAHEAGALAGFDLAHAAGNIPLHLHDWNVDFAAWCNYKYLNGGPGAIGSLYVHERHHGNSSIPRLAGWWGNEQSTRFLMEPIFRPEGHASGWQLSTPPILLLATLEASLDLFLDAGWENLCVKQNKLTSWLWFLLDELNRKQLRQVVRYITPRQEKGCQVSLLTLENGTALHSALSDHGIMTDWREPDVIRMAPVPFYNSYEQIWHTYEVLSGLIT